VQALRSLAAARARRESGFDPILVGVRWLHGPYARSDHFHLA
jgi:hypothetical protein